jgi:hypothetical protein
MNPRYEEQRQRLEEVSVRNRLFASREESKLMTICAASTTIPARTIAERGSEPHCDS